MGAETSHHPNNDHGEDTRSYRFGIPHSNFGRNYMSFFVNGKEYTIDTHGCDEEIGPTYLLIDYLRNKLGLTGTKFMCREGGCGSCIVTVKSTHPSTGEELVGSVNSCLLPLYACDGLDITTVEALGNQKKGYDKIQQTLVKYGGTQCGFCTPGFIMNMHSVVLSNPQFKPADVEYSFDGNICRCTGFRPIIDAFKSLSTDSPEELKRKCIDIEDSHMCPLKAKLKTGEASVNESMEIIRVPRNLHLRGQSGEHWFKVITIQNLFDVMQQFVSSRTRYRLIAGNTGTGVYKNDGPYEGFIEINDVPELKSIFMDNSGIMLGGNVTLTAMIDMFEKSSKIEGLTYTRDFLYHCRRIASLSIRNRGTIAGNLMLKHMHNEFYSDVFLLFEAADAKVEIGSSLTSSKRYSLTEFLDLDMTGQVILYIYFPTYSENYFFRSFKVGKRYQNAISYVNAAFLFEFDQKSLTIHSRPRICFGGINPDFVHASQTEKYLDGKKLTSVTLQQAMKSLADEAKPNVMPDLASPEYRIGLAQSFLYKFFLEIMGNVVKPWLRSGAYNIERSLNKSQQNFETDRTKWPLNQPIPKIESYQQTSGEAQYINDIRPEFNELHGVFVISTVGNATVKYIDVSQALNVPGVVGFYTAKDIPGENNFGTGLQQPEEVFAESTVKYVGQAIGILVANSRQTALEARDHIKVKYSNFKQPVVDIADAVNNIPNDCNHVEELKKLNVSLPCHGGKKMASEILESMRQAELVTKGGGGDGGSTWEGGNGVYKLKGEFQTKGQAHFPIETQICICVPKENGMDVFSSTQSMEITQNAIAAVLNVPVNFVSMNVRRLGGSFGAKCTRSAWVAAACAVAAHVTNQPVRVVLDLETDMQMFGKRLPYLSKYEVQVNDKGKILRLDSNIYCDAGSTPNEPTSLFAMICSQSCYQANKWNVKPGVVSTNTAANTYCRAPGSAQGVALIETILEHISHTLNLDPMYVREVNFISKGDPFIGVPGAKLPLDNPLPKMIAELKAMCDYDLRKGYIDEFNRVMTKTNLKSNRWKKRGISILPLRFPVTYWDFRYPTFISVYHADGSVNVSHGGIEMGQGVNTKVAQVVAYTLKIPLEKIRIQASSNIISPNTGISAGSITSELVCSSARKACLQLLKRLEPVRKVLKNPTWEELIAAANVQDILLTSQYQDRNGDVISYDVWGVTCTEVEVDVLTGDYKIVRSDIVEDAGESMSPLVDIGQIEGAYVMGLGWWLTEELIYDKSTGALLTDNTWSYKPMLPADIPEDFRVTIMRNAPNPFGVLSSKATGEPPLNMSVCVIFALRHAIDSARNDIGDVNWYQMNGPVTREAIRQLSLTSSEYFTFK